MKKINDNQMTIEQLITNLKQTLDIKDPEYRHQLQDELLMVYINNEEVFNILRDCTRWYA